MESNLNNLRHSAAHLLAAAVRSIWPEAKNAIGPSIENGFYQDFDFGETKISDADLPRVEQKMHELVKLWNDFEEKEVSIDQAKKDFAWNPYKLELIEEFGKQGKTITENNPGNFLDLCKGGHVHSPSQTLKHFKLLSVAGAYWRGSEKNPMLTRIYGTAFPTQKELENYLHYLSEAKKRDHKKIGPSLDLFMFADTAPGMPYWLPKGLVVYNELLNFSRKIHKEFGYQEVATPILSKKELYETSGHWFHYRDDMFVSPMSFLRDESKDPYEGTETFGIKPMNCPNAMTIFGSKTRSYRDLPLRFSETSPLHRFELSGTLNGLFRAREFRQDDAHVFVRQDQIQEEFGNIMQMIEIFYKAFDLSYRLRFGTRPENFMGDKNDWEVAEKSLQSVLDASEKEYVVEEGEGTFYGPKVDILMKDSLGREWQTGTIQLDFQQPKNFKLQYTDSTGEQIQPVVLHRAIYGSFERFLGILIEHFAGALPLWLAPTHVAILPVSDKVIDVASAAEEMIEKKGIRVELKQSNDTLGAKIREATLQKIPYLCIIGEKEVQKSKPSRGEIFVSVRTREGKDLGEKTLSEFLTEVEDYIEKRTN